MNSLSWKIKNIPYIATFSDISGEFPSETRATQGGKLFNDRLGSLISSNPD